MLLNFVQALSSVFDDLVRHESWDVAHETELDDLAAGALVWIVWIWNEFETGDWYIHTYDTRMFWPIVVWILEENGSDGSIW
jgi:hypothetical protein